MFERYTVLFVGYSHDDVVTSYLMERIAARGARPALRLDRRNDDPDKWNLLDISPITPSDGGCAERARGTPLGPWPLGGRRRMGFRSRAEDQGNGAASPASGARRNRLHRGRTQRSRKDTLRAACQETRVAALG